MSELRNLQNCLALVLHVCITFSLRLCSSYASRQPLISFVYERGWRQNFASAGFPGKEKEFDMAMNYLTPVLGGTLIDVSCGTGLFSRLFARSGKFKGVVALDYSETMLKQAQTYFNETAPTSTGYAVHETHRLLDAC